MTYKIQISSHHRQILRIALPSIVSNITVPLLGLIDVAIVGHLNNISYIGAIAIGSMIFNLVYWVFGFLRMGTSGMTSQALGNRNLPEVTRLLLRSLTISSAIALLMILLQIPLHHLMFALIKPTPDIAELSSTYFYMVIWGAPAMMLLYGLTGWFIGMQNTRIPMFVSIMQNIVNIIVSLILVLCLDMGFHGVATGTVIAQYAGLVAALTLLLRHYGRLHKYIQLKGLFAADAMLKFFRVNSDIFLRTLFLVAVNLFFTSAGAQQGAVILAVNTLLMQLYLLFSYIMDGFAYAGEALCGRYYGANNTEGLHQTVRRLCAWGAVMVVLFTIAYSTAGKSFLELLTDDTTVIAASGEYFIWALAVPVAGAAAFIWDGVFIGITATRGMLAATAIAAFCFFVVKILLQPSLGNHALWMAQIVFLSARGAVQTVVFYKNHHIIR